MVRIGLVKRSQPVVEMSSADVNMDDSSSTTSSSTEGQMMSDYHQIDIRHIPYSGSSMTLCPVGEGKAFSELLNDVEDLSSRNLTSRRSFATLPQQVSDDTLLSIASPQTQPNQRDPIDLQIVNPSISSALKKLQIHPTKGADELHLAHGLAFRPSWNPTNGELMLPAFAKVHPNVSREGDGSSSELVKGYDVLGTQGIATQPLSVLCRYADQSDDLGRIVFDVASPTHLLSSILDEIAVSFSTASMSTSTPSSSTSFLQQSGMEHASLTVKLLKSLFGNDPNDDAYASQEPSMKTTVLGSVDSTAALTVSYEESNRRRRLKEWLLTYGNIHKHNEEGANIESDQIASGRRGEASRSCRNSKRFAESILLLTSTSDEDVRRLLRKDETKSSTLREATSTLKSSGSWIKDFHQFLTLSDRNTEPTLKGLISKYFDEHKECRPPFYEKLSSSNVEKTELVQEILSNGLDKKDICWYLLQLWAGQGATLHDVTSALCDPMTWQHSYGDYSLNWVLCILLSNSPAVPCNIPEDRLTSLTCAFVDQLMNMGAWQWALFTALTIPSEATRRRVSVRILARNIANFKTTHTLSIYGSNFDIPKAWIEEAAAIMTPVPPVRKRLPPVPVPLAPYIEIRSKVDTLLSTIYDAV